MVRCGPQRHHYRGSDHRSGTWFQGDPRAAVAGHLAKTDRPASVDDPSGQVINVLRSSAVPRKERLPLLTGPSEGEII
jgi:hypothetical protein